MDAGSCANTGEVLIFSGGSDLATGTTAQPAAPAALTTSS